jgi:hypothetical protein
LVTPAAAAVRDAAAYLDHEAALAVAEQRWADTVEVARTIRARRMSLPWAAIGYR